MQHNANNMVGLSCSNHQQPALSEIPPQSSNVLMEKETSVHASSNNLQSLSELYEMIKECCSNTASHDIVTPCESENGGDTVAFDQNSMVLIDETIGGEDDEGQPLSFGSTITISSDNENEDGDGKYEISANPPPNGFVALQGQCNNYLTSNVDPNVIMMPHNTNLVRYVLFLTFSILFHCIQGMFWISWICGRDFRYFIIDQLMTYEYMVEILFFFFYLDL